MAATDATRKQPIVPLSWWGDLRAVFLDSWCLAAKLDLSTPRGRASNLPVAMRFGWEPWLAGLNRWMIFYRMKHALFCRVHRVCHFISDQKVGNVRWFDPLERNSSILIGQYFVPWQEWSWGNVVGKECSRHCVMAVRSGLSLKDPLARFSTVFCFYQELMNGRGKLWDSEKIRMCTGNHSTKTFVCWDGWPRTNPRVKQYARKPFQGG